MSTRIHIVLDEAEKERFRRSARLRGESLSEWLRDAAREKLVAQRERSSLDTVAELRTFFAELDRKAEGVEPDWQDHRRLIEDSVRSGATGT